MIKTLENFNIFLDFPERFFSKFKRLLKILAKSGNVLKISTFAYSRVSLIIQNFFEKRICKIFILL